MMRKTTIRSDRKWGTSMKAGGETTVVRRRWARRQLGLACQCGLASAALIAIAGLAQPASAITFNITFDASQGVMPTAQQQTAFGYAAAQIQNLYNDNVTINLTVTSASGTSILGESNTFLIGTGYSSVRSALLGHQTTPDDVTSAASIGSTDPTGGASFIVATSEAKTLGLLGASSSSDGTYIFGQGFTYTYDPANRAVPGAIDFIGVCTHEITELMGRIDGLGEVISSAPRYAPLDLFRWTGPGSRTIAGNGASVTNANFSIDAGTTLLKLYNNGSNGGDYGDWASGTNDSFNAFSSSGVRDDITPVDTREMDVLGYSLTSLVWKGTTDHTTWDLFNTVNWSQTGKYTDAALVLFDDTSTAGSNSVTLNATVSPTSVTVNSNTNNYTISGTGNISGPGGLTKSGSSTLIIATNNTYAGVTLISGGTLQIGNGGTVGNLSTGAITDNANLAVNRSDNVSMSNTVTGTGTLTKLGANNLTLMGINNYSGGTIISAGTLTTGVVGALPSGGAVTNNASFVINANGTAGAVSGSGTTTVNAGKTFTATDFSQAGGLINNGATQINGNGTVGPISGAGALTIGNGSTSNTLALAHNSGGSTQSTLTINTGAKLNIDNNHMFITTTPLLTIRGYVVGGQIFSGLSDLTHAVGYATVTGPQVEVKWTLKGDTNLDGTVDVGDLGNLATSYGSVTTGALWAQGDFNYDGTVDVGDLGALATNYGLTLVGGAADTLGPSGSLSAASVPGPSIAGAATGGAAIGTGGIAFSPSQLSLGAIGSTASVAAVPEPASTSLIVLAGAAMLGRRRKRIV